MQPHIPIHWYRKICVIIITMAVMDFGICQADTGKNNPMPKIDQIRELDLDTAITIALKENPTIEAAALRIQQADARLRQARSTFWPQLNGTLTGLRTSLSERMLIEQTAQARLFNPNAEIDDPQSTYRARLSATWLFFNGFKRKHTVASAQTGFTQFEMAGLETHRLILATVARSYFAAQLARENLAIAQSDAQFNRQLLAEAEARRRSGTGSLSDELNFKVRVNAARAEEIRSREAYQSSRYALAAIMGLADAQFSPELRLAHLAKTAENNRQPKSQHSLLEEAMAHRPDLRQLEYELNRAKLAVKIARADYFPNINAFASMDGERPENAALDKDDFGNTFGLELSLNLFAGGLTHASVDEAKARVAEKAKETDNVRIQIRADVLSALANYKAAQQQLALQRDNVILVENQRDLVKKEYKAGQGSLVRLNEAQKDLTATRGRLALAMVSVQNAWFKLRSETGEILGDYPVLDYR